jgi:transposase
MRGSGPLSQWLYSALAEAELPVVGVETRHMQAVLKAQINKTDRNDARGMAQMMRVGLYRPVHVKTLRSQKLRMLLTHRQLLQSKAIAIENDLRDTLRNFGLKVGMVWKVKFEARVKERVENQLDWPSWSNPCSLCCGHYANRSSSCIAVCWPSFGMMRCASAYLYAPPQMWR